MKKFTSTIPLHSIEIAAPCRADWNMMQGDDQTRFCKSCQKNVYNLSEMSRDEAENLIAQKEGKLCVRFYQREDGTMLTADCPIGIQISAQIKPRWAPLALAASALMLVFSVGIEAANASEAAPSRATMGEMPAVTMGTPVAPTPKPVTKKPPVLMGRFLVPKPAKVKPKKTAPSKKKSAGKS